MRSEADRAPADRKLIPVKLSHLTYKDLPPPFDLRHTEDVGQVGQIKAAVIAQLAKPAMEPPAGTLLAKGFKWELLTWWGIIGGAITLFGAISTTLKLADWAQSWLGIHLPPEWTPDPIFSIVWVHAGPGPGFQI